MNTATQTPPSTVLPPCRRVKVAWLAGLMTTPRYRSHVKAAFHCIDIDDRRGLVTALDGIRAVASWGIRDLAEGAMRAVEQD